MNASTYRAALEAYIWEQARPVDKFSHQPRLYRLATKIGEGIDYDDDVVHAGAWLHDLGVFFGHRPELSEALSRWDNTAYAVKMAPQVLARLGFPSEKIPHVLEVIATHQASADPVTIEATLLRDADILEQLGAVGILRVVSKVGRDTRFPTFAEALQVLRRNAETLPKQLRLATSKQMAEPRLRLLGEFLEAASVEAGQVEW